MQLKYVFSETGTGLRRNVSMTIALVVTIFVSLTLVGMGLLLNSQANKAQETWGSKLQITVFLCNQNTKSPNCDQHNVTADQKQQIERVLHSSDEVASYYSQSKKEAFATWKRIYVAKDKADKQIYSTVKPSDMQESYWIQLKDPTDRTKYGALESQLSGMAGVDHVRDLRQVLKPLYQWMSILKWGAIGTAVFLLFAAILQVANTIRLAAFARRKEIGIMRLVGASTLYISLPFLMETLIAALVGIVLCGGALAAFLQFVVYSRLRGVSRVMEWIDWSDGLWAFIWVAIIGVVLTTIPTLFMTRKYLKV